MSGFEDRFVISLPTMLAQLGEQATYDPVSGADSTIDIFVNELDGAVDEKAEANFYILKSQVSDPQRGDRVVMSNGDVWTSIDARDERDGTFKLRLRKPEAVS